MHEHVTTDRDEMLAAVASKDLWYWKGRFWVVPPVPVRDRLDVIAAHPDAILVWTLA